LTVQIIPEHMAQHMTRST